MPTTTNAFNLFYPVELSFIRVVVIVSGPFDLLQMMSEAMGRFLLVFWQEAYGLMYLLM